MRKRSTADLLHDPTIVILPLKAARDGDEAQYTTDEAAGAWRNGTRVRKRGSLPGDAHQDGARAAIVGSIGPMPQGQQFAGTYGYFVEWDDRPGAVTFVAGVRLALDSAARGST